MAETVGVISLLSQCTLFRAPDHVSGSLGVEIVDVHLVVAVLQIDHAVLAALSGKASLIVVAEEVVKTSTIDVDVL